MKVKNMTIAALALLLAACGNEDILENNESGNAGKVRMTFTAGMPQTRTQLAEGNAVHWTAGDKIAIYDGTASNEFPATDIDGSRATFTGEVTKGSTNYTAFYPYTNDGTLTFGDGTITFTLPTEQTATAGGFANGLNPSWAQATDGSKNLDFQNLCALVKFTVDDSGLDGVTNLTLSANTATEKLAGSLTYTTADGTLAANDGASQAVTLKGTFEAGQTYYFVVAPGTLTGGITLSYTDSSNGLKYLKTTSNAVTLTAGRILNLGKVTFQPEAITNTAFIEAVGDQVSWTKEDDGTVLLTDANKQAMAEVKELDVHLQGLTDLPGIEYFTGLTSLDCSANQLTSLDLTGLTKLAVLYCSGNNLTTLDLTGLTRLNYLDCSVNQLTTLDITRLDWLNLLLCGQQNTTDGNMTLYLTTEQYNNYWGNWGTEFLNLGVTTKIRD